MPDIVLDTNILADLLAQYFDPGRANYGTGEFLSGGGITRNLSRKLNRIVQRSRYGLSDVIVASAAAFVEIGRRWQGIVQDRFSVPQFEGFVRQPPEWFDIAPVDEDLLPFFIDVPIGVRMASRLEPVEWVDALHVATAISRGQDAELATTDQRLSSIPAVRSRLAL